MTEHITPDLFSFLRALKRNNTREWFKKNQARYESVLREPLRAFIRDFEKPLTKLSSHFVADDSKVGGSLFRIHKDTRFSKDKTPYKTNSGVHFRHELAKDVHAPGFYLHLEPGRVFVGAGIWHPDPDTLRQIRERIVEKPAEWKRVMRTKVFASGEATFEGERLKRPPRGFDGEHELIEDIKRKDFIAIIELDEKAACSPAFARTIAGHYKSMMPLMRFCCDSVGVEC
jgi:uncharacterized protein (TIGR02453 family)